MGHARHKNAQERKCGQKAAPTCHCTATENTNQCPPLPTFAPLKTLTLHAKKERALLNRHPWLFSGAMANRPDALAGEIVRVADATGKPLALGFYNPEGQIVARMFEFDAPDMEHVPDGYWHERLAHAYALRRRVLPPHTNAYRLLHAEGDFLPGIIADVYADTVVLQILIRGTERLLDVFVDGLAKLGFARIYLKTKDNRHLEGLARESGWLLGTPQPVVEIMENNQRFLVDVEHGQKTGFFLDQRENRALVGHYAKGMHVLNAFSYTGGFSVYALAGGASLVHSVDISADAVARANENVALNFGPNAPHQGFAEDCFDYLKRTETRYDMIVLDPPAFAKNARSVPNAARGYKELNLKAFKNLKPGGMLFTYSCSQNISVDLFRKIIFGAAADAHRNVRIIAQLSQASCHPINIYHPEGEYLKGLVLFVE